MSVQFVERRHRNMVSIGDVLDRGHGKERVVDMRSPGFILTVPAGRKDRNMGTLTLFWRDVG